MFRGLVCTVLLIAMSAASIPARAEVVVQTDRFGEYRGVRVTRAGDGGGLPDYWSSRGPRAGRSGAVLNPFGRRLGDLAPAVAENPLAPHHPWAVWSRFNGQDRDLAWSAWTRWGWLPVQWIEPAPAAGDDREPDIAFDGDGRPFVAWARANQGSGQIFISLFLESRWMTAFPVTDSRLGGRLPEIRIESNQVIWVDYETDEGVVSQQVLFKRPVTITDDINPQRHLLLNGAPIYLGPSKR